MTVIQQHAIEIIERLPEDKMRLSCENFVLRMCKNRAQKEDIINVKKDWYLT